jgi:hypothetical protein
LGTLDENTTYYGQELATKISTAKSAVDAKVVEAQLRKNEEAAKLFSYRLLARITTEAKKVYGQEIAVEVAFEDWKITNFAMIRDLIRSRARKDKYFVTITDMLEIIDIVIDEQSLIVTTFEQWSSDEDMLRRFRNLKGVSKGLLHTKGEDLSTKTRRQISRKLHQVFGTLIDLEIKLPSTDPLF